MAGLGEGSSSWAVSPTTHTAYLWGLSDVSGLAWPLLVSLLSPSPDPPKRTRSNGADSRSSWDESRPATKGPGLGVRKALPTWGPGWVAQPVLPTSSSSINGSPLSLHRSDPAFWRQLVPRVGPQPDT